MDSIIHKRWLIVLLVSACLWAAWPDDSGAAPLATLQYRITGTQLQVSPAAVSVPKGVPGSVLVQLVNADGSTNVVSPAAVGGAYIEAIFRGPGLDARRLIGQLNALLSLPPLNLVGDYELDNARLLDGASGAVLMEAAPSTVPIHVFDQVLISQVTSRPLTYDEIQQKGIVIDSTSFRAVEFEVGFVLNGQTVPIKLPVVAPTFSQSTEIIPQAEVNARLAQAAALNQQIASTVQFPPELQTAGLNIDVQGINFQRVDVGDQNLALQIPPIPALMVIPGNIGYLHQFFSVQIFTENGAPAGSGLSVLNIQAHLNLPTGPDLIPGTYDNPGDDPLRFARIGPNKIQQSTVSVARPGPDGVLGTADDIGRLYSGETGQGEFLVEGLQEGLQVLNLDISADLDGLAAGIVKITGKAAGSVLVRNPTFSLAFSHPGTVRAGEPYDAFVTILNTSPTPVNLVSVTLPQTSLSGGVLLSPDTVQLGTILPGQSGTAHYRVLAQRTGAVSFSNLTTGSDAVSGRFRLTMGIDERGVPLSPDTIAMPDFVGALPTNLVLAANRVLGQALSVATAPQLPAGVLGVARSTIARRVVELAEAGQRLRYGDGLNRVLADLLLDWQGGRLFDAGFDQITRSTDAGRVFRETLFEEMEKADTLDAVARLSERGGDFAGRAEPWQVAAVDGSQVELSASTASGNATLDQSSSPQTAGYRGGRGNWQVCAGDAHSSAATFQWTIAQTTAQVQLSVLLVGSNGSAQRIQWTLTNPPVNACYYFSATNPASQLLADVNCDGTIDFAIAGSASIVAEQPPELLGVVQDSTVDAGRPNPSCLHSTARNYGTVLAVLYSKPMNQDQVNVPGAYQLDDGNTADSVQIQAGARVALLNMRRPVGAIHPRTLALGGISDPHGNLMPGTTLPIQSPLQNGVAVRGRVVRADSSPAAGIPVTLTMYDQFDDSIIGCTPFTVRVAQVNTDTNGFFTFDFVLADVPYSVSATDTGNLPAAAIQAIIESTAGVSLAGDKLLQLANSPSVANSLLSAFAVNNLPQAIAAAEGLDRAVLQDVVATGSARIGTEVAVALRFRGRGTVNGQVLASDGVTPLAQVAVNLFPDPGSREQGRGVFSDASGNFSFSGVPLGLFSIQAQSAAGLARTVAGELDTVGQVTNMSVVLSAAAVTYTGLKGQVFEADNVTPHPRAQVFVGKYAGATLVNVVAAPVADATGFWTADGIPADTYDVVALSFDGARKGDRRAVAAQAGVTNQIAIALQGTSRVVGRVETSTGTAVPNALVAGGEALVRSDSNGLFTLTGVPTGQRTISAGLERNAAAGADFPRFGSASVNVLPGIDNFVVVRFDPAGQVIGRVLDADGTPVPNISVAMPLEDGFQWVYTDGNGEYKFENLALGKKIFSAPGPGSVNVDTTRLVNQIQNGTQDQIQVAIGEAYSIFTGASDPFLNGQGSSFNPGVWGYNTATLSFDGQTVVADIQFLRTGTISGTVKNAQGVPIGARVRLTGIGPLPNGLPSFVVRGEQNSDPALGTFQFSNQAFTGSWGLQAASPFYPSVIATNGVTSPAVPDATNIVLQFPPVQQVNGRLAGTVFTPDGAAAGSNVNVRISFGPDYVIQTDGRGMFDTQIAIPAGGYNVEADDPATGLRGQAGIQVVAGITNICNIHLLGRGDLMVTVLQANGAPAAAAQVNLEQGSYPGDRYQGGTDTNGAVAFANLFEGTYAVEAQVLSGSTTIYGRAAVQVQRNTTAAVTVTLAPTANLHGRFVQRDLVTPVSFAQVSIGSLGFAVTDSNGVFAVTGIPLGTYRLYGQDSLNGRAALLNVALNTEGETRDIQLIEQALGDVSGFVVDSYNTGFVPGASVTLSTGDGITPSRTVTTGPDGSFDFPGTPAGALALTATDPGTGLQGQQSATLPDNASSLKVNIPLQRLARLSGVVFQPDGVSPASNATVQITGGARQTSRDTDASGRVTFADLPLGDYSILARALSVAESHSVVQTNVSLSQAGVAPDFAVVLSGVGAVSGRVFDSTGIVPVAGATLSLVMSSSLVSDNPSTFSDSNGNFNFSNVAVGSYRITVEAQALAASANGQIRTNLQLDQVDLVLGASGSVTGRLDRSDGITPVSGVTVLLTFDTQSGLPGRATSVTDTSGRFAFSNIPVGPFTLEALAPDFNGIARDSGTLPGNGQVLDLGTVVLDEADPQVVAVSPANTAVGVSIDSTIELQFSKALDPSSLNKGGMYLRSAAGIVPASVQLVADTNQVFRIVRLTPSSPL
ncbi:MAG TPA: carboxypeptidase regulatory-like domain-containing protein, partial [Verrucomicrobiae bacterium]|nr:carboxypeptidase regulatory-like domain-containing protein [Verrucomicrobiae bacterium]